TARATLLAPVYFDFDRSDIRSSDHALVEQKANILRANVPVLLRVEGNTDERGSDEYNLALGMRRAAQVRRALMMQGVDSARVAIISNGEERSTCREPTEACWSRDRRAEFVIVAGGERITAVNHRP
ncbi:MAG TPA: OmpA family protein, partial [Gemmatimonadaceae bacterium]